MSNERQLIDLAFMDELWGEAAIEMLKEDWDTRDQADFYGLGLADAVAMGDMSIDALRSLSIHMNILDKEVVEKSEGDLERLGDADYFEAIARRIGNQATSSALEMVKSKDLRRSHLRDYMRRLGLPWDFGRNASMPGMGRQEGRDRWLL